MWSPITKEELENLMSIDLNHNQLFLWNAIKINPEKWIENEKGKEGNGFWVVAILGKEVIWYNDIEEGFNISPYSEYGLINDYGCEQDRLDWCLNKIISRLNNS